MIQSKEMARQRFQLHGGTKPEEETNVSATTPLLPERRLDPHLLIVLFSVWQMRSRSSLCESRVKGPFLPSQIFHRHNHKKQRCGRSIGKGRIWECWQRRRHQDMVVPFVTVAQFFPLFLVTSHRYRNHHSSRHNFHLHQLYLCSNRP